MPVPRHNTPGWTDVRNHPRRVKQISNTYQRNTGHHERGDECTEHELLCAVDERRPAEHIKIGNTKHVPRIYQAGLMVEEVVVDENLIPGGDKVDIDIECDLQIAIHAKETGQRAVDRIVKGDCIETDATLIAQEVLVLIGFDYSGFEEAGSALGRSSSTSIVERTECITTRDFSGDEEVVLADLLGALVGSRGPFSERVDSDLGSLINSNSVDIECYDGHAGEFFDFIHHNRLPLAETILD